jgi:hypothetical protein
MSEGDDMRGKRLCFYDHDIAFNIATSLDFMHL